MNHVRKRQKVKGIAPVTKDLEDAFLLKHEKRILEILNQYLSRETNIVETIHIVD